MSTERPGVRVVGAGSMAKHHLDAWRKSSDTEVVAIYSRTRHKVECLASEYEIPGVCSGMDELVSSADADIVSVCTPHNLHLSDQHGGCRGRQARLLRETPGDEWPGSAPPVGTCPASGLQDRYSVWAPGASLAGQGARTDR